MATLESSGRRSVQLNTYPKPKFNFTEKPFINNLSNKFKILIKSKFIPKEKLPNTPSDIDVSIDSQSQLSNERQAETLYGQFRGSSLKTPTTIGLPAIKSFYSKFKDLNRANPSATEGSVTSAYLKYLSSINHSPQPMGLVKQRGLSNELNLNDYKMGDKYAAALSKSVKHLRPIILNLSGNRISQKGATEIIGNLCPYTKHLDLSRNSLGPEGARSIRSFLETKAESIQHLNLSANCIGDHAAIDLFKSVQSQQNLQALIMDSNSLTDACCPELSKAIESLNSLKLLSLHWNAIRGFGGIEIINAVKENFTIRVLDLGWNSLGTFRSKQFADTLAKLFNEENLLHIDISHNGLDFESCSIIAKSLTENHTLIGIHIDGNYCKIDSKGFVIPTQSVQAEPSSLLNSRMQSKPKSKVPNVSSKCWICEGWSNAMFTWDNNVSGETLEEPVFLHLECDDYQPELMLFEENKKFTIWRMIPPGPCKYFYSHENRPFISKSHKKIKSNIKINQMVVDGKLLSVQLHEANCIECEFNVKTINDHYQYLITQCFPRYESGKFIRLTPRKIRTPWSLPISIFKDYKVDNDDTITYCFEFDWKMMPKLKMSDSDYLKSKELFRGVYKTIKENFKVFSAIGRTEAIFGIPWLMFNDLAYYRLKIVDGEKLTLTSADLMFKAIKGKKLVGKMNSKLILVRFEFLEALFRLAVARYFDSGDVETKPEAVKKFIENNLKEFSEANSHKWRVERYWNEECDNIIKANISLFHQLYNTKGGLHKLPGEKIFMSIQEFIAMLSEAGQINDVFTERDAAISFNLAKITEVDEINYDKHMKLYFLEFLEALSRCADIMSLPPPNSHEEEWPLEARKEQILAQKLENLLPLLLKICKKEFIEKYKFPSRDAETNLFVVPNSPTRSISKLDAFGTTSLIRETSILPTITKEPSISPSTFKISRIE